MSTTKTTKTTTKKATSAKPKQPATKPKTEAKDINVRVTIQREEKDKPKPRWFETKKTIPTKHGITFSEVKNMIQRMLEIWHAKVNVDPKDNMLIAEFKLSRRDMAKDRKFKEKCYELYLDDIDGEYYKMFFYDEFNNVLMERNIYNIDQLHEVESNLMAILKADYVRLGSRRLKRKKFYTPSTSFDDWV